MRMFKIVYVERNDIGTGEKMPQSVAADAVDHMKTHVVFLKSDPYRVALALKSELVASVQDVTDEGVPSFGDLHRLNELISEYVSEHKKSERRFTEDSRLLSNIIMQKLITPDGASGLVSVERRRQINEEGFDAKHDERNFNGELLKAAKAYMELAFDQTQRDDGSSSCGMEMPDNWPWDPKWWKPSPDPIRSLVKAAALIVAEIDRLELHKASGKS